MASDTKILNLSLYDSLDKSKKSRWKCTQIKMKIFYNFFRLGSVAGLVIQATERPESEDL